MIGKMNKGRAAIGSTPFQRVKKVGDFFDALRTECSTFAWNTPSSLWVYSPFYRRKLGKKGALFFEIAG